MLKHTLTSLVAGVVAISGTPALSQVKDLPWGTSAVGSSGHRALVAMAEVLNREMPNYRVTVQPTPGAIVSVKGYATGEFEGYYGADIAFHELANDINRFEGFQASMERQPVQSFWTFTVEVSTAIHSRDRDEIKTWGALAGKRVFTGPRPWDVRAHLERAYSTLGVEHEYVEVDLSAAGSLLESGAIDAFITYTNAEATTAPWIIEASLAADWAVLNPSADEIDTLEKAGFAFTEVKPEVFNKDVHVDTVVLSPFYYGFHVGLEVPEDDLYQMLMVIEQNAAELAEADAGFAQIAEDMSGMQRRGVEAAVDLVPIHPGLAKYMREKGVWNAEWDAKVAQN